MGDRSTAHFFTDEYGETLYKRAIGELPEMESSKAAAKILTNYLTNKDSVLDVGCAAGHYLRSLKNAANIPFSYTGIDLTPNYVEAGRKAWAHDTNASFQVGDIYNLPFQDDEFDIVMSNNLLYHLESIVKPITELVRVSRRLVLLRMLIGDRSFYIKEVHSTLWDGYSEISPEDEFEENGEPASYNYLNIYSQAYVEGVISKILPTASVTAIEDTFFDPNAIEDSKRIFSEGNGRKGPTSMVGQHQVVGYIIQPFYFIVIHLNN